MHARSTTLIGDPAAIDAGIAHVRDQILPTVTAMEGCLGMSLVVDRESGRCIATTSWETEEAMAATRDRVVAMRAEVANLMNAGDTMVEEWEVAVMHRDHNAPDGSACRITWTQVPDIDQTLDYWRRDLLPQFEQMPGFCSASMLVDRAGSRGCGTVVFDSRAALETTREQAAAIREGAAQAVGVRFLDVAEFDLAMAHLRLPEMA